MRIHNLVKTQIVNVPSVKVVDLVVNYQAYSLGGGEWSIEAKTSHDQSPWGASLKEWVGRNGTRTFVNDDGWLENEPADNLWREVEAWEKDPQGGLKVVKPAYSYQEYKAPDGKTGSLSFFRREIMKGRLHGCVVSF